MCLRCRIRFAPGAGDAFRACMVPVSDTIAALGTPRGTAALAVLRVSGPDSANLATALLGALPSPRQATHADYRAKDGRILDDVLATYFKGPHSYTGEDALEISCHGNPLIAQSLLEDLLARGCRAAEPGEFTRRAYLNGRLDLSQAEAVMDLIHARSERALAAANQQLRGSLGRHLETLVDGLLHVLARVEAYIDFPEEDLPAEDRALLATSLEDVLRGTSRLLATSHYGTLLREGVKTVIVGEPNAGKSSLLNRLVGRERALVSELPGTTRDFLEERVMIGSHCVRLIDTAGLNERPEALERKGMEKAIECVETADILLVVVDATLPFPCLPALVQARAGSIPTLVVLNKVDLVGSTAMKAVVPAAFAEAPCHAISAQTGEGIDAMTHALLGKVERLGGEQGEEVIAINARHADALRRAEESLVEGRRKLREQEPIELLASDLRAALDALGEIGGRIDNERMLDRLFATFCIGK